MSEQISLLYLSFGRNAEYLRTIFSIWSFYARAADSRQQTQVMLFTDAPDFFSTYLEGLPVRYVLLTPERMVALRGEINFVHRIKIGIIEEAFQQVDGSLLYVDGDTFFTADPENVLEAISEQVSLMHRNEYDFDSLQHLALPAGALFHKVRREIRDREFTLSGGERCRFSTSLFSWNAGVIGLHSTHEKFLNDVYAVTDQLFVATGSHASEQFAFSLILQSRTALRGCEETVFHYWYRIRKDIADSFLATRLGTTWAGLSRDEKCRTVNNWTRRLSGLFENHVLTLQDNAIQAFNRNEFGTGCRFTLMALLKNPFDFSFIRDFLYHTKRLLFR